MSYGLVRQVGPWPLTTSDLAKVAAPAERDPSDVEDIRPYVVTDGNAFMPRSVVADRTVMLPSDVDPRIALPGRRISINWALGAKRQPLEGQGALKALSGAAGLNLKLDTETGRVIDSQFMDQRAANQKLVQNQNAATIKKYNEDVKKMIEEYNATPAEKRNMTPGEMTSSFLQGVAGVVPYMIPFLGQGAGLAASAAYSAAAPYLYGDQ